MYSLFGTVDIQIVSADLASFMRYLSAAGVVLKNVVSVDELKARVTIRRSQLSFVNYIAETKGASIEVLGYSWVVKILAGLKSRPLLMLGIAAYFLLVFYLPCKILFVCVEGNSVVPANVIIEKADLAGISFGADRRSIRSEHIKNILLSTIPNLEWAGVNTAGCVATISVKEKILSQQPSNTNGVCSIVAARDGIIDAVSVTKGSQQCKVGQAVKKGQVLVSGYIVSDNLVKLTSAEAEIYALTTRESAALVPLQQYIRTDIQEVYRNYSLVFQKKEIKLQKGSGISGGECVKMYSKYTLTLPGGFQLPFSVIKETVYVYKTEITTIEEQAGYALAEASVLRSLQDAMVAGTVLSSAANSQVNDSVLIFYGKYLCREMISKEYEEEIITGNE